MRTLARLYSTFPVDPVLLFILSFLSLRCLQACTIKIKEPIYYARIATVDSELIVEVQLQQQSSLYGSNTFVVATVHHDSRCCCAVSLTPLRLQFVANALPLSSHQACELRADTYS
jgi:hypothetical protein